MDGIGERYSPASMWMLSRLPCPACPPPSQGGSRKRANGDGDDAERDKGKGKGKGSQMSRTNSDLRRRQTRRKQRTDILGRFREHVEILFVIHDHMASTAGEGSFAGTFQEKFRIFFLESVHEIQEIVSCRVVMRMMVGRSRIAAGGCKKEKGGKAGGSRQNRPIFPCTLCISPSRSVSTKFTISWCHWREIIRKMSNGTKE